MLKIGSSSIFLRLKLSGLVHDDEIIHTQMQGSPTRLDQRATFQRENALRGAVYSEKAFTGRKLLEKL
jgi:hypothetical protein